MAKSRNGKTQNFAKNLSLQRKGARDLKYKTRVCFFENSKIKGVMTVKKIAKKIIIAENLNTPKIIKM